MYFEAYKPTKENVSRWSLCNRILPDLTEASIQRLQELLPEFMSRYWRQRIEAARTVRVSFLQRMTHGTEEFRRTALEQVRPEMLDALMKYIVSMPNHDGLVTVLKTELDRRQGVYSNLYALSPTQGENDQESEVLPVLMLTEAVLDSQQDASTNIGNDDTGDRPLASADMFTPGGGSFGGGGAAGTIPDVDAPQSAATDVPEADIASLPEPATQPDPEPAAAEVDEPADTPDDPDDTDTGSGSDSDSSGSGDSGSDG